MDFELLLAYVIFYGAAEMMYLKLTLPMYSRNFAKITGAKGGMSVDLAYAALAYVALFGTVYYFVIRPIFAADTHAQLPGWGDTAMSASVLALAIYGVYNLTNLATLRNYSSRIAAMDTAWGVFAINAVAVACRVLKAWVLHSS